MVDKQNFFFSTDSYNDHSIKAKERIRRVSSDQFAFKGPATIKPVDFKQFFNNEINKKKFCDLLLNVWKSQQAAGRLKDCKLSMAY